MYSSIRIQGYRGLDSFRMQGLGRVNLLVGTNNCGKTSVLECIELLRSVRHPYALSSIVARRGEWGYASDQARARVDARSRPLDLAHLFANHELANKISIRSERAADVDPVAWNDRVTICVEAPSGSEHDEQDTASEAGDGGEHLILHVKWADTEDDYRTFITDDGLLYPSQLRRAIHPGRALRLGRWRNVPRQEVQFVGAVGVSASDVVETLSQYILTPQEESITQALRIVEPEVERIAPVVDHDSRTNHDSPGGVVVKLRDGTDRVPIGSLGDGLWRMLGLALAIADAQGGVLLIDEIDTGFHYSVMEDMWRMIAEQAAALSVQVFATTHSRDCYESLAAIAETDDVTIQRIDRSRGEAVRYSREAVAAVAHRSIEVR